MLTAHLRKVGGSVMLPVPPAILELLHLQAGVTVGMSVDNNRLVIEPRARYTLAELLSECDSKQELSAQEREWVDAPPVGRERL